MRRGLPASRSRLASVVQAVLPKSASRTTMETAKNNKVGLSSRLDATMKEGVHDVQAFGLGFLRSCSSLEEYRHFTAQYAHVYTAMEDEFERTEGPLQPIWAATSAELRRAPSLLRDLRDATAADGDHDHHDGGSGNDLASLAGEPAPATAAYLEAIVAAGREGCGERLIGHFWCRYFADLYGGRALGLPTRLAMYDTLVRGGANNSSSSSSSSSSNAPHFYSTFPASVTDDRHAYIDGLYGLINQHGDPLGDAAADAIVEEGRVAFRHNAAVYTARPGLPARAALGALRIVRGAVLHTRDELSSGISNYGSSRG